MDVVIVNWNSGPQIKQCIDSLSGTIAQKIIVVDNASSDGSEQAIATLNGVTLIRAEENLGFGKACNLGAQLCNAEFLLFLNPDAAIHPDTLDSALAFMQRPANTMVGICGVQLLDESGHVARSCSRFPSVAGFAAHSLGLDRIFPRFGHFMNEWAHDTTREVDQVMGAFFLVRRTVFETVNGFDERFFVYFEEVDLSYRASQLGWRSVFFAETQAFHAGGGTSRQIKAKRLFYSLRSRLLYAEKHFSVGGLVLVFLSTLLVEPLSRSVLALLRHSWTALKETWSAYIMLWCWLPMWFFKGVTR